MIDIEQIRILKKLGINPNNCSVDVFTDLLNVSEYLYDQLEQTEIDRFRAELIRIQKATN